MIKFLCPSGHPLSAPENMAGKRGKCPRCEAAFLVPMPEAEQGGEPPSFTIPSEPPSIPASGSGPNLPAGEVFVFLCPNGHKLNGPPTLKGKPGKCPHCGARFRIPDDDDVAEAELSQELAAQQEAGLAEQAALGAGSGGFLFPFGQGNQEGEEDVIEAAVADSVPPPPAGPAGLGYIVARLWEQRDDEAEVEIFLAEGEIISPDYFSEVLSSSDYGVFAIEEGDGSFAVTVIPWSAVRKVTTRKLGHLPEELFG
jgi:hypothetical protein